MIAIRAKEDRVSEICKALIMAFASLLHPRMLLLMLWPVAIALALWLGLALAFWSQAAAWLQLQFGQSAAIGWAITVWPLALFGLIPLLGFLAPVYGGLAFIHYCLARLAQLRGEPVATQ